MRGPFPTPANRPAAAFLAVIWCGAGLLAIYAGVTNHRWIGVILGVICLAYSALWVKVFRSGHYVWFPFKTPGVKDRWPKDKDPNS
jgi:hypothetical protein